jgi:hypothetical protein
MSTFVFYLPGPAIGNFKGVVERSSQRGGDSTAQQSSSISGTTTTQEGDGGGIPNPNDSCLNIPNTRCY